MMTLVLGLVATLVTPPVPQAPDYAALYGDGITYSDFLAGVSARAGEWRLSGERAAIAGEATARVRGLTERRKVLVVTEPSCSDSVSTIPYLAKLVELAPDRLEMRLVNSKAGRAVMEAHRTPDGRAATPTVVILDGNGSFVGAWIERPELLQRWHAEHKASKTTRELYAQKMKWYEEDAGKSTVAEIVSLLTGASK